MLTEHPVPHNSPLLSSKIVWIITLLLIQMWITVALKRGKKLLAEGTTLQPAGWIGHAIW
jgi:hypothetical protein